MCVRQQSLMQQTFAHKKEGDGDAVSCSTDTSRWSTTPRPRSGPNTSHCSSDYEDQADPLTDKTPEAKSSVKSQGSKPSRSKKGKKGPHRQKTNYAAGRQVVKLPPIKPLQVSRPRIKSANLSCIRELQSQVGDLQQQLSEARTENKLLKRVQHRHTVALQHFQDSEGSLSQILTKHNNEARVLQELLRETRACRDSLARQLQATENKLLSTKASLQHLQLLSQDYSLLEREELTLRLTRATAELEDKDKRILDREKELEIHNIYSHRFLKGFTKKGRQSKTVQTDGLILLPDEAVSLLELEYTESEERLEEHESSVNLCCNNPVQTCLEIENPETDVLVNVTLEENHQEDTETCADTSEQNSLSEESLEDQTEGDCAEDNKATEAPQVSEEEQETEEHESEVSYILEKSLNATEPKRKGHRLSKIIRNYTFSQSTENLHSGRPAYSTVDLTPCESTQSTMRVESLHSGIKELHLPAGKSRRGREDSPQCE
uniref:Lebercilin-like protein n=1 Tax=Dicentrarchus labrax TaxID=13489 RepID=A0A8P4KMR7_DICLA